MRVMAIVKASKDSEASVMPSEELLAAMGKFNEEMVEAGVMLAGEGLHPSSKGARVSFKMFNRRGQIWGSGDVKLTFRGSKVTYSGSARITGGSGAFSRIRASGLRLTGGGDLTGSRFPLRLTGHVGP